MKHLRDVPVSQTVLYAVNFENGEHVTNFTPWLMEYFEFKRSLHPHPRMEGISLSLGLTFHSFQPRFTYGWDNLCDVKGGVPGHILLYLSAALDMSIKEES